MKPFTTEQVEEAFLKTLKGIKDPQVEERFKKPLVSSMQMQILAASILEDILTRIKRYEEKRKEHKEWTRVEQMAHAEDYAKDYIRSISAGMIGAFIAGVNAVEMAQEEERHQLIHDQED